MTTVIFACVHNAGRSQMAAAFFNAKADPTRARAISAGTEPASAVHPVVKEAMSEIGIDVSTGLFRELHELRFEFRRHLVAAVHDLDSLFDGARHHLDHRARHHTEQGVDPR